MAIIETLNTGKAQEFLAEIRRSHPRWRKVNDPTETRWLFRGQHDANLPLLPRAFRKKPNVILDRLREDIDRRYRGRDFRRHLGVTASLITCDDDHLREAALDSLVHAGAVRMFMTLSDEVRRPIVHSEMLWHVFNEKRDEFRQYFAGETSGKPEEIFAVAQHHGLPHSLSRLLSLGPLGSPHARHLSTRQHHSISQQTLRMRSWLAGALHDRRFVGGRVRADRVGRLACSTDGGPALLYGVATLVFPFFVLQPSLGFGVASARTANPTLARLKSLGTHTVFGVALYGCAVGINVL